MAEAKRRRPATRAAAATYARARGRPEGEFQDGVLQLCRYMHLRVAHFRPALTPKGQWLTPVQADGKGFPDLVIVGPGGVLFRELKADGEYPTPEQRQWLADLRAAGVDADVWRPADMRSGRIQRELEAIRRRRLLVTTPIEIHITG